MITSGWRPEKRVLTPGEDTKVNKAHPSKYLEKENL